MSWHRVIIKHSVDAHLSAQGLMIPFVQQYKEAGAPEGVAVYISRDEGGDRIYYFSSHASSLAKELLHTFHATRCFAEPNLESCRKIRL
jgi:hypothetical protein